MLTFGQLHIRECGATLAVIFRHRGRGCAQGVAVDDELHLLSNGPLTGGHADVELGPIPRVAVEEHGDIATALDLVRDWRVDFATGAIAVDQDIQVEVLRTGGALVVGDTHRNPVGRVTPAEGHPLEAGHGSLHVDSRGHVAIDHQGRTQPVTRVGRKDEIGLEVPVLRT